MRKLLALPFEAMHVLGMALFFGVAATLTLLTAPGWLAKVGSMSSADAARHFHEIASLIGRNGLWVVLLALVGGIVAPYARGDGKKLLAFVRVGCTATAAVIVLLSWGHFESLPKMIDGGAAGGKPTDVSAWHSDKKPTPWNCLMFATGLNLVLGAFQIHGGGAKKAKSEGKDKK